MNNEPDVSRTTDTSGAPRPPSLQLLTAGHHQRLRMGLAALLCSVMAQAALYADERWNAAGPQIR
jgi:hypothetical protein